MTDTLLNISLRDLCQLEGIDSDLMIEVVDYDIVKPIDGKGVSDWVFDVSSVYWLKKAVRLYQDLEIDWVAVAMVIDLMQQRETLIRENKCYLQQIGRFVEGIS